MASVNPRDRIGTGKARLVVPALLALSFILIFGAACVIGFNSYREATRHAISSNETRTNLLAKVILEHQRAAIGVLRSYASRPRVIEAVRKNDFEETVKHLKTLVKENPEMEIAFVADPTGTVWVNSTASRERLNENMSHRDWYKGVGKNWTPYVSSVYKMVVGEKDLAVAICAPLRDEKDNVIGILAATQTTGFFNRLISEIGLNADSKITLVDQEGQVIYSNKFPYTKEVTAFPCFRSVKEAKARGRGNVEIRDPSDRDRVKYISFEHVEGIGWSVFAEKDRGEVLRSEFAHFIQIGIISILLFTAVVLFLAYFRQKHKQAAELGRINAELETRVRLRTAELEGSNRDLEREITERKATEEALRHSEERFRALMDASSDVLYRMSPDWREMRQLSSRGFLANTEKPNRHWLQEYIHPNDQPHVIASVREAIRTKSVFQLEHRVLLVDGSLGWTFSRAIPVLDANGEIVEWFGAASDITERKRAEETLQQRTLELQSLTEILEHKVQGRTNELKAANERLKESEGRLQHLSARLLEAQEEERRRIAADVHDSFSASVSAVKYLIELALKEIGENKKLQDAVSRLQQTIEDSRRIQMALRPSVLDDLGILAALNWLSREFRKTYSHIKVNTDTRMKEQEVPHSLKLVIFRIAQEAFNNIAKHSQADNVNLSLANTGSLLKLNIQDNGVGVSADVVELRKAEQRGLGLSSMEERAALSGGIFSIHSSTGHGTLVQVSWPLI